MKKYFNVFIPTLLAVSMIFVFSACSKKSVEEKGVSKITIWHTDSADIKPYLEKMSQGFEKLNEGKLDVELVHYSVDEIHQQYQTAAIAGTGPDLILVPSDKGGIFNVGGFILPVEKIFNLDEYVSVAIDAVKEKGHVWGIPYSTGNHIMLFYNKKMVKKAPTTTIELANICKNIKENNAGAYCIATNLAEPYFFIPWFTSFDGWVFKDGKPSLNEKSMTDTLKFTKDLTENYSPPQCEYTCMDSLFKEGKVAMITNGDWAIDSYKKTLGDSFGIAVLPMNSETKTRMSPMVSGKHFMLNSRLKDDRLSKVAELVKYFTNYENQLNLYEEINRLPGNKKAFMSIEKKANPMTVAVLKQLRLGKPMPITVDMRAVWDAMRTQLAMYFTGKRSAVDAANKMQNEATRKIAELNN